MIGLLLALIGLAQHFMGFKQVQEQDKAKARADFWQYQTAFIQATQDIETRIVRQFMVLTIYGSLWNSNLAIMLAENASRLPVWMQAVLLWEFFGASALLIFPWVKGKLNGNGNSAVASTPLDPNAAIAQAEAADQVAGGVLGKQEFNK